MYWVSTKRQHSKLQSKVQSYNTAQRADMKWYLFQKQWNKLHTTVNWRLNKKHAFKVKVDPVKWFCQHKYVLFMSKSEILHCQSDSIIELPFLFFTVTFYDKFESFEANTKTYISIGWVIKKIWWNKIIIQVLIKK